MKTFTLYADAQGVPLRLADEDGFVVPPPNGTAPNVLELDSEAHADILAALAKGDWDTRWRLLNSVLTHDGVTVPVAQSAAQRDRKLVAAIRAKLDSDTAPTAAELRVILRFLLRKIT